MEEEATEACESTSQEANLDDYDDLDDYPPLPPPVPRRVQELRNPRSRPRKRIKSRARERLAKNNVHRSPSPPRWREKFVSALESGQSFSTRVKVLRMLLRIPELRDHVPQLVSSNANLRSYTVRHPRCELVGFEYEARRAQFSYGKILRFKHQLYGFVKLMYQSGVRYNIYPGNLFVYTPCRKQREAAASSTSTPTSTSTPRHVLFIGAVEHSDLVDATTGPDWSEYRKLVWEHINRVFALPEIWTFRGEALNLIAAVDRERDVVDTLIRDNNAAIDAAREDVDEARTIMVQTAEVFNKTVANIKRLQVLSEGLIALTRDPLLVWEDAQCRKEVLDKNLKKIDVLGCRTTALLDKYCDASQNEAPLPGDEREELKTEHVDLSAGCGEEVVIWDESLAATQEGEETIREGEETIREDEETVREEEVVVYEDATAQDEAGVEASSKNSI
ncbi:hypothetical protein ACQKWADRAFT_278934 [Trichoderma austrokoningii]